MTNAKPRVHVNTGDMPISTEPGQGGHSWGIVIGRHGGHNPGDALTNMQSEAWSRVDRMVSEYQERYSGPTYDHALVWQFSIVDVRLVAGPAVDRAAVPGRPELTFGWFAYGMLMSRSATPVPFAQ
jgi:hypothetical protein